MSSGSVRLHAPRDIHQHEDPPEGNGRPAIPDGRGDTDCCAGRMPEKGRLWREDGKVMYRDADNCQPQAVRIVWARPLSRRGDGPVSIMLAGKKQEVAYYSSLEDLPEESRAVAREELAAGTILPRIAVIHQVKPRFGNYYFDVDTDMGRRKFLLSSPENNSYRPAPDVVVVRDVSGNCYEIAPISGLSPTSRRELDRVL